MSDSNEIRARRAAAGLCTDCGGPPVMTQTKRCAPCKAKNSARRRRGIKGRQARDLAEMRAIKTGRATIDDLEPAHEGRQSHQDCQFIRAQPPQAIPLLSRLYKLSQEKINSIRGSPGHIYPSQRMPLKLLKELVEQREATMHIDHFTHRESSIALCAENR